MTKWSKVTWEELGITPPIASMSFSQNNPSWSALKSVLKCDIGYLCLTKLWSMFNGCNNLVSVEAIKTMGHIRGHDYAKSFFWVVQGCHLLTCLILIPGM